MIWEGCWVSSRINRNNFSANRLPDLPPAVTALVVSVWLLLIQNCKMYGTCVLVRPTHTPWVGLALQLGEIWLQTAVELLQEEGILVERVRGQRVVELGSGTGLAGLCAAAVGGHVLLTDIGAVSVTGFLLAHLLVAVDRAVYPSSSHSFRSR
jgi:hypothetical protein